MSAGLLFDTIAESDPIARGKALCHRYCERAGKADDNQQLKHHKEEENHDMVESRKINGNILITPTILGLVILASGIGGWRGRKLLSCCERNQDDQRLSWLCARATNAFAGNREEQQGSN